MTRIIGGQCRGMSLRVPTRGTRPTSDRVREALFSTVEAWMHREGLVWSDMHVLDLCAGSGAVGLEAASRGAASVTLYEDDRAAFEVLRANVDAVKASCGAMSDISAVRGDARRLRAVRSVNLVYLDPPYSTPDIDVFLAALAVPSVLDKDALVVVERSAKSDSPWTLGWEGANDRGYGDTRLWYGHHVASNDRGEGPLWAGRSDA